jgi:hypothetical protein
MISEEFESGPKQVAAEFLQGIYHGQALVLNSSIIIFGIGQLLTGKIDWIIDVSLPWL